MIHELKTWPIYFEAILNGSKTFEVRKDDRGFSGGDRLILKEYVPTSKVEYPIREVIDPHYTGREVTAEVTYVLSGEEFGIMNGYVVMGIKLMKGGS